MLIERRQWVIGAVAAVVILAGTAFAAVTTGSTILVRGDRYTAEFTDASALKEGDFVFVSGVRAGQVTDVAQVPRSSDPEFADVGPVVVAEFALGTDAAIPADAQVEIMMSNTLGKRGLAVVPSDNSPEHLAAVGELEPGDHITLGRTSTLVDLPEFSQDSTELLEELDVKALTDVTRAVADVTQDQRADVDRLFDGVQDLAQVLVDRRQQLGRTLDRAEAFVDVAESRDDEILQVIDNFQVTLDTLLAKQDEIERLLVETADTSTATADLVEERRAQIDRVVGDLTQALDVVDDNQVNLAHTLPYLQVGLGGFSSIGYVNRQKEDTGQWGNVFTTGVGLVGVEALLGCGSDADQLLSELFGPDPNCDGTRQKPSPDGPEANPGPGADDEDQTPPEEEDGPLDDLLGGLDTVFRTGLDASATPSPEVAP